MFDDNEKKGEQNDYSGESKNSEMQQLEESCGDNATVFSGKDYNFYQSEGEKIDQENNFSSNTQNQNSNEKSDCYYYEKVKPTPKKTSTKRGWAKFVAACLIISIAGGSSLGVGLGITQNYFNNMNETSQSMVQNDSPLATPVSISNSGNSIIQTIQEVTPSVVSISTKAKSTALYFGGLSVPYESSGAGSGVIFYSDTDKVGIVTNEHVIENATDIQVTFDGDKTVQGKVVGKDNTTDLAVLTITKEELTKAGIKNVKVATFGNSDNIQVGESVIAIGNALGEGLTATDGIISAKGKQINVDGKQLKVIQTNAAINPGNSGGALVDKNGRVIGINTAKSFESAVEGMGYAIPSNIISPIMEQLLKDGFVPKPYIGIRGSDITEEVSQLYQLPIGVLVREVIPGGSAEQAGLQAGDIITKFGGKTIMTMDSLVTALSEKKVGDTVQVHIIREGTKPMDITLKILDANEVE